MLDIKFFVNEITILSIALCFFIGFLYIIVKIQKSAVVQSWTQKKINYYVIYFFMGLFVGLISIILNLIQVNLNTKHLFVSDFSFILMCAFFTTPAILSGSTLVYITISVLFQLDSLSYELLFVYILLFYLVSAIILSILKLLRFDKFLVFVSAEIVVAFLLMLFALIIVPTQLLDVGFVMPWLCISYMFIFYLFGLPIMTFIGRIERLSEAVKYNKHGFVLPWHANAYLLEQTQKHQIRKGLIILFNFEQAQMIQIKDGMQKYNEIIAPILKMIRSKIDVVSSNIKPCWFLSKLNHNGVFVPIDDADFQRFNLKDIYDGNGLSTRKDNDIFLDFEKIFNSIPKKLRYENVEYDLNIKSTSAIYGIHSSDFEKLTAISEILMSQYDKRHNHNLIQVYDPNEFVSLKTDAQLYSDLLQTVDINDIKVELTNYSCQSQPDFQFYYGFFATPEKLLLNKKMILNKIDDAYIESVLIRFMAIRAIRLFCSSYANAMANKKLIIDYPIYELNSNHFSISKFFIKLKNQNIGSDHIVVNIAFDFERHNSLTDIGVQNIKKLADEGIHICASGLWNQKKEMIKNLNLDYAILDYRFNQSDYEKSKDVDAQELLDVLKEKNVKVLKLS